MKATVKVPAGLGDGTATIVLKAETNPDRTTTVSLKLGNGGQGKPTPKAPKKPKKPKKKPGH
jgi:hypothetical protein